jgi:hypothetical protein
LCGCFKTVYRSALLFSHWYSWIGGAILLFSADKDSVRSLAATVANVQLEKLEHSWYVSPVRCHQQCDCTNSFVTGYDREAQAVRNNYFIDYLKEVKNHLSNTFNLWRDEIIDILKNWLLKTGLLVYGLEHARYPADCSSDED